MRRLWIGALIATAIRVSVAATSVIPPTFEDLTTGARGIIIGRVVARESHWIDTSGGRAIVTLVTFSIEESLKGGLQTQTSLEFLGGTVGDVTMGVAEMPQFTVGERDVLFIGLRNAVSPLIGFMHGRFRIERDVTRAIDTVRLHDGRALNSTDGLGHPTPPSLQAVPSLSLAAFRSEVLAKVRASGGRQQ